MTSFLVLLSWTYFPLMLLLAAVWGGRDERVAVAMMLCALMATHLALRSFEARYRSPELGVFAVDAGLAIGLIILALRSDRFWPLWATSFHLLSVYTHAAIYLASGIAPFPYAFLAAWWSWPTLGALVIGAFEQRFRKRIITQSALT